MENIIFNVIIIIIVISITLAFFISFISSVQIHGLFSVPSIGTFSFGSIFLIVIILLFLFIFPITFYKSIKGIEHFEDKTYEESKEFQDNISIQMGRSGIEQVGNISFDKPFNNIPRIFTQIIGDQNNISNAYSVQVFNITPTGFSYSKNKIVNSKNDTFSITQLQTSTLEPFDWLAISK